MLGFRRPLITKSLGDTVMGEHNQEGHCLRLELLEGQRDSEGLRLANSASGVLKLGRCS